MELKITNIQSKGTIEKHPIRGTSRVRWVEKCTMTLEDGSERPLDVTADKKKNLPKSRDFLLRATYNPETHLLTRTFG